MSEPHTACTLFTGDAQTKRKSSTGLYPGNPSVDTHLMDASKPGEAPASKMGPSGPQRDPLHAIFESIAGHLVRVTDNAAVWPLSQLRFIGSSDKGSGLLVHRIRI